MAKAQECFWSRQERRAIANCSLASNVTIENTAILPSTSAVILFGVSAPSGPGAEVALWKRRGQRSGYEALGDRSTDVVADRLREVGEYAYTDGDVDRVHDVEEAGAGRLVDSLALVAPPEAEGTDGPEIREAEGGRVRVPAGDAVGLDTVAGIVRSHDLRGIVERGACGGRRLMLGLAVARRYPAA